MPNLPHCSERGCGRVSVIQNAVPNYKAKLQGKYEVKDIILARNGVTVIERTGTNLANGKKQTNKRRINADHAMPMHSRSRATRLAVRSTVHGPRRSRNVRGAG